jgi:hypothetical protein
VPRLSRSFLTFPSRTFFRISLKRTISLDLEPFTRRENNRPTNYPAEECEKKKTEVTLEAVKKLGRLNPKTGKTDITGDQVRNYED